MVQYIAKMCPLFICRVIVFRPVNCCASVNPRVPKTRPDPETRTDPTLQASKKIPISCFQFLQAKTRPKPAFGEVYVEATSNESRVLRHTQIKFDVIYNTVVLIQGIYRNAVNSYYVLVYSWPMVLRQQDNLYPFQPIICPEIARYHPNEFPTGPVSWSHPYSTSDLNMHFFPSDSIQSPKP
jgi:hypothetical protein